jgi:VWFA-related protein
VSRSRSTTSRRVGSAIRSTWFAACTATVAVAAPVPEPSTAEILSVAAAESVEVRVINLDLHATDSKGRPVELTASDLRLEVDGRPVPLRYFARVPEAADAATAETGETSSEASGSAGSSRRPRRGGHPFTAPGEDRRLRLVFLVDDFFLGPASRARAIDAIHAFVEPLPEGTEFLLASFDRRGLTVRVPFTGDRRRLLDALDEASLSTLEGMRRESDRRSTMAMVVDQQRTRIESPLPGMPPCGRDLFEIARAQATAEFTDAERSIKGLRLLIDSLAATPGKKALIHVSDGIPLFSGTEVFELLRLLCDGSGARQGIQWSIDVSGGFNSEVIDVSSLVVAATQFSGAARLREVTSRANSHGITIYPLQANGLSAVGGDLMGEDRTSTPTSEQAARGNLQDTLSNLATETGGLAILQRNDLDVALAGVADDLAHYWSLGFEPPGPTGGAAATAAGEEKVHSIRLTTTLPGVRLRYRTSYRDVSPGSRMIERLLATLFHGAVDDPLGVRLGHESKKIDGAEALVVRLRLPYSALTLLDPQGTSGARRGMLAIHVLREDDRGVSPLRRIDLPVERHPGAAGGAEGTTEWFSYDIRFAAPRGKTVLVIGVEDVLGNRVSLLRRVIG